MTTVGTKADTTAAEPVSNAIAEPGLLPLSAQPAPEATHRSPLYITSVRWGQTVNVGNYSSVRLDVEAGVPMDGEPGSTLEELQTWAREHLPLSDSAQSDIVYETRRLQNELHEMEEKTAAAHRLWGGIVRFLEANSLPIPKNNMEDLPI